MAESQLHHLRGELVQGILVLTIRKKQLRSDEVADALRQEFITAVDHFQAKKVAVDFRLVEYISSAGIRPFLALARYMQDKGGRMLLFQLPAIVNEVLTTLRLVDSSKSSTIVFETAPDLPSAIARLNEPVPATPAGP